MLIPKTLKQAQAHLNFYGCLFIHELETDKESKLLQEVWLHIPK